MANVKKKGALYTLLFFYFKPFKYLITLLSFNTSEFRYHVGHVKNILLYTRYIWQATRKYRL